MVLTKELNLLEVVLTLPLVIFVVVALHNLYYIGNHFHSLFQNLGVSIA